MRDHFLVTNLTLTQKPKSPPPISVYHRLLAVELNQLRLKLAKERACISVMGCGTVCERLNSRGRLGSSVGRAED